MRSLIPLILLLSCITFCNSQNTPVVFQEDTSDEEKAIQILLDSSSINYDKGNFIASLKYNIEIIDRATAINNATFIYKGYRYLAYDYLAISDTLLARESFKNAKKYAKLTNNYTTLGESFMDLGNLYSSAYNDYKSAYKQYDDAIIAFKKAKDTSSLTKAYINIVICALFDEDYKKVKQHLTLLEQPSYSKFFDEPFKNSIDAYWSDYYLYYEKDYEKANEYALKAIPFAKEKKYYSNLQGLYSIVSESYYNQKKYKEAADYNVLLNEVKDINFDRTAEAISEAASAKFQIEQYQKSLEAAKETAKLQAEIAENRVRLIYILIIVCIGGLFLLISLFVAYRKRKSLNNALEDKNKEYLEAKHKSDHLSKAKSKFFSTVSHELRTPLYGVIGLSSILLEDPSLKSHEKDLKSLKFSADYLLALINDVLQINKIDSKNLEEELINFNLAHLLSSITTSFEYMRLQNKNKFHVDMDDSIPKIITGSSVRLSQILMNLIGNACKFTENGDIYISAKTKKINDKEVTISFAVKDTGMGISEEKHKTIFNEFAQIDSFNYTYQGTGLGLPIVKKLLNLSNSDIKLESEIGKGSTFSFDLDFNIASEMLESEKIALIDESAIENKNILIVEDNRINQIVTKKILEKKGAVCSIADNGEIAVQSSKDKSFDLILMDLNMPVKGGIEATKEIREFDKNVPIIALTAVEVEEIRNEVLSVGMNDIIVKPYDVSKFIQTINTNITSGKGSLFNRSKKII